MDKALSGVRILDMTHVQSGPSCTQILAWLGADVIKVELPGRGDITRGQLRDMPGVDSLYFTMLNCNKRSITLNIKSAKGKHILDELIKRADVLVENFGPGVLDREGFTWERMRELNPRLIFASIKGFGPGPFRGLQGLRDDRAGDGRFDEHDRFRGWTADQHRRANRRLGHRNAHGGGDSCRALSAHPHRARATRRSRDAGLGAQSVPRQASRPAAAGARAAD